MTARARPTCIRADTLPRSQVPRFFLARWPAPEPRSEDLPAVCHCSHLPWPHHRQRPFDCLSPIGRCRCHRCLTLCISQLRPARVAASLAASATSERQPQPAGQKSFAWRFLLSRFHLGIAAKSALLLPNSAWKTSSARYFSFSPTASPKKIA